MESKFYGVDVSKETLDIACDGGVVQIENSRKAIRSFIKTMPAESYVAMESTNTYHVAMADVCHCAGMGVYVVNPRVTRHYREALSLRGHNDRMDARTLCKYIREHHDQLRRYVPKSVDERRLHTLIRRRAKLVRVRVQLKQSMGEVKEIKADLGVVINRIGRMVEKIDLVIDKQLEANAGRERVSGIKGVGPVVSAALVADLQTGNFRSGDAFVAFYGLDPQPNDSGKSRGRRRISKRGQRLGRTLLYNAAMSAARSKAWKPTYEKCLAKGLSKVQALVCLARKIARTAWSVYTHKTEFNPARLLVGLT